MVQEEALLVLRRENGRKAEEALLVQLAVASLLDKKAGEKFNNVLKILRGDD